MNTVETNFRSLSRSTAECQRHIERLQYVDSTTVQKEISELIRFDMRNLQQDVAKIKELAEEQDKLADKMSILNRLGEYEEQLKQLQSNSRVAILRSKKRVDDQDKKNRQELFGTKNGKSFTEQFELKQFGVNKSQDESLLRASSDVTEALRKTSTLLQQELEKSSYSASMLADSSKTLQSTYGEYQNFGSLIHISKRLVAQLENSDWFDRILLLCGMMLFCLVVLYIIKKRTWDVGISWVSWITQTKKSKKILQATTTIIQQTVAPTTIATATSTSSSVETTSSVIESAASVLESAAGVIESVVTTTAQTILPSVVTVIKDEL